MRIDFRPALLLVGTLWLIQSPATPPTPALPHDAYVWQRRWTPAVQDALRKSEPYIRQWRVLAGEVNGRGDLVEDNPAPALVQQTHRLVVAVIRIDGQIPSWSHETIVQQSLAIVRRWRDASVDLAGVEIDHDCGTARLGAYAEFLGRLRQELPPSLALSVTALPAWLDSPGLAAVLGTVDESILQVHAVVNPRQGLFDRRQAIDWIRRWSHQSPGPFRVALPSYGSRVTWNSAGGIASVESEMPRFSNLTDGDELVVRALDVMRMMQEVSRSRIPRLAGYVWFRLPTADDRRAWTLRTWLAVIGGTARAPLIRAEVIKSPIAGTFDVFVTNDGPIDDVLPPTVEVAADACEGGDGLDSYSIERMHDGIRFRALRSLLLAAGERRQIGWVRCASSGRYVHAEL